MNLKNMKVYDLGKVLFAEGWFFFVPYLFFYLVFKYFHLKIFLYFYICLILYFLSIIYIDFILKNIYIN